MGKEAQETKLLSILALPGVCLQFGTGPPASPPVQNPQVFTQKSLQWEPQDCIPRTISWDLQKQEKPCILSLQLDKTMKHMQSIQKTLLLNANPLKLEV